MKGGVPLTGQSTENVHDVPRAGEPVARLVRGTAQALEAAARMGPAT